MSELMKNVFWTLGRSSYADSEEFIRAVSEYQLAISPEDSEWDPNAVIASGPITVTYTADWKEEDESLEVTLGEAGQPLTMGQALFELNNATVEFFAEVDHCFFEGLEEESPGVYVLCTGS
jgi:hypothetical protein